MRLDSETFQFNPDASVETLLRQHRVPRTVVALGFEACIILFASMAQTLVFGFDLVSTTILLTALCVTTLLFIPALLCFPLMKIIEKELVARGIEVPGRRRVGARFRAYALRLMGWTVVIVIVAKVTGF